MGQTRLHYIPLTLFLYFPVSFAICFCIALSQNHINFVYTFISDTGTLPPEQYVFAQLVNMGAALFAYFIYIRYVQVDQYMRLRYSQSTPIGNTIALAFGFTACLGMSLVGNFPELYVKAVHLIGAFLTFVSGSIYIVYQGYYTFKLLPHFQSKTVAYVRIYMGILGLMLYFGAQTTVILAFHRVKNKKKLESGEQSVKWSQEDGGYEFQAASVIMEWLLFVIFDIFVMTFIPEFKKLKLGPPPVTFNVDTEIINVAVSRHMSRNVSQDVTTLGESYDEGDIDNDDDNPHSRVELPESSLRIISTKQSRAKSYKYNEIVNVPLSRKV